ncbi:MAG: hypothetical protein IT536_07090 [Hyphomicrobiales bacterium]|nr:hypothetical protein [Hyphomicrobiales bacterium]
MPEMAREQSHFEIMVFTRADAHQHGDRAAPIEVGDGSPTAGCVPPMKIDAATVAAMITDASNEPPPNLESHQTASKRDPVRVQRCPFRTHR